MNSLEEQEMARILLANKQLIVVLSVMTGLVLSLAGLAIYWSLL